MEIKRRMLEGAMVDERPFSLYGSLTYQGGVQLVSLHDSLFLVLVPHALFGHAEQGSTIDAVCPMASAAASCDPAATPPEAMYGTFKVCKPRACKTKLPTSSSPGCPAHSKPSKEIMSVPTRSAFSAWRIEVHL